MVEHLAVNTPDKFPLPPRIVRDPPSAPSSAVLVYRTRGGKVEGLHRGAFVLSRGSHVVASAGDPNRFIYARSTLKPFQALAGWRSGAWTSYGLTDRELAVAAASHNAEAEHLEIVQTMLERSGLDEHHLQCGGHRSIARSVARTQVKPEGGFPALTSNCSGKHAMMLCAAKAMGAPLDTYLDPTHPVQIEIRRNVAACVGMEPDDVHLGVDGCGAPVHRVSIHALARAMATLGVPSSGPPELVDPLQRVRDAMAKHPFVIAGTHRFDTALMVATGSEVIAKVGAEGVYGVAVPKLNLGLAVKVDDGSDHGYQRLVLEVLRHVGILPTDKFEELALRYAPTVLRNHAGAPIGQTLLGVRL